MGGQHGIGGTYREPIPQPVTADYHVEGTLNPDSTCNYDISGIHDGENYLRRKDGAWFVWYSILYEAWFITHSLGELSAPSWSKETFGMEGDYFPGAGATGIATLSPGVH
jgi:hypothetical protein